MPFASVSRAYAVAPAADASYDLNWYAADPALNKAHYLPTYVKQPPSALDCPTPSGGTGRAADPLADAVAYKAPANPNDRDAVTSLMPKDLALGQIVPFELEVTVNSSGTPEDIIVTPYWLAKTTSGRNFGFDPAYGVYCAFVDTADPGTSDPGANARVASFTSTTTEVGTNDEQIQGAITLSGLDNGDRVIVEIWVVLKSTIGDATGNVQTGIVGAETVGGDKINVGNQTVPLLQVGDFVLPVPSITIDKRADPLIYDHEGQPISYTFVVTNTGSETLYQSPEVGGWVWDSLNLTVTCPPGTSLAPGAVITCSATYAIGLSDLDAGSVSNLAVAIGLTAAGQQVDAMDEVTISADQDRTISLDKIATPISYSTVGQLISYSYLIKNEGNQTLYGPFTVADDQLGTIICPDTYGLFPGETLTCHASYHTRLEDLNAGAITNKATATDGNIFSNQDQVTVIADTWSTLELLKSADPLLYSPGDVVVYTYSLKNTGNVTLHGPFTVNDDQLGEFSCASADLNPNESVTCTKSYPIAQPDMDAGTITNIATASNGSTTSNDATATVYANQNTQLELVKRALPLTYEVVGTTIQYSYDLKNTGNVSLSGPFTLEDNKLGTITCPSTPTSLAPDDTITCSASHLINQIDLDAGSITNKATGYALFDGKTVESNPAEATVTAISLTGLTLVKTADPTTYSAVDQVITYIYLIENTGNQTLHGPFSVSDDQLGAITCTALDLAPGDTATCTATYPIDQTDLDAGSITNIATATNGSVSSNDATATVSASQNADLTLDKSTTTASYDSTDDTISYSYMLTNSGNVTLSAPFSVDDDKILAAHGSVTCPQPASLAPGESITCTASYPVSQADLDAGAVTNLATGYASFGQQPLASNPDTLTVQAEQHRALAINKTAKQDRYATADDVIGYEYLVTNTGNVTLHDAITVSDDRIIGTNSVSCPALPPGGLLPGHAITCTASYPVSQIDLDAGAVTNTAFASSGATVSPTDDVTVTARQTPKLTLDKIAGTVPAKYTSLNQPISYSYLLTNSGNVTLSGPFTVSDDKILAPASVSCPNTDSLAPGDTLTCEATYLVRQTDLDAGAVTNLATAHALFGTTPVDSNQDTATVEAEQTAALSLEKTSPTASYDDTTDTIHYDYVLTNSGNVTLSGPFTLDDDKTSVTCDNPPATLLPGHTLSCTASYPVTQTDLDAGAVTNHATAHAFFGTTPVNSNQDTVTVKADQIPALSLDKTSPTTSYDRTTDTISYSYLLTNSGNVTLAGPFTLDDDKIGTITCGSAASLAPGDTTRCTASYPVRQIDLDAGSVTNIASASNGSTTSNQDSVTVYAKQILLLELVKQADRSTYDAANQTITYRYILTNGGNVTLSGPFTLDDDKTSVTCANPPPSLLPGESLDCTASYPIQQIDLDNGAVTNIAQGHATFGTETVDSNEATVTVNAESRTGLTLTKQADPTTYSAVGQVISYAYTIQNTGNVTLKGPFMVMDNKLGDIDCTALNLAPGDTARCTATYPIKQSDLDAGAITNRATASNSSVTSNEATATVSASQNPDLTLEKRTTTASYDSTEDTISYSYLLTNTGNVTLNGPFVVIDNKITGDNSVDCPPLSLAPGDALTCTATYPIKQADLNTGLVTNIATAYTTFGDSLVESNQDSVTVNAEQHASLSLDKTSPPATYTAAGQTISYQYLIKNTGNVTLYGPFTVSDNKISDGNSVSCPETSSLLPGDTLSCSASYTISQDDVDRGTVTNIAKATNGNTSSNDDTVTVGINQTATLQLEKSSPTASYASPTDTISYSYVLKNSGNVTLSGPFTVEDDKTSVTCEQPATLLPGHTLSCEASYPIKQSDLNAGSVTNKATGHAFFGNTVVDSNEDTVTVSAEQTRALSLEKTSPTPNYDSTTDTISYGYRIENSGNVTLAGPFMVDDDKIGLFQCGSVASLAPGGVLSCTASYPISQIDLDNGSVTNIASASNGSTTSNQDSVTINAEQSKLLELVKQATPATYDSPADTISYDYLLTNTGNVTLSGPFTVDDDKASVTCDNPPATLLPGHTLSCTASYPIQQSDLDNGAVTNIAQGHATFGTETVDSNVATATVNAESRTGLTLIKKADPTTYSAVDQVITYEYMIKNTGNVTLIGPFTVTDDKLGTIECIAFNLAPDDKAGCTATYTIKQSDLDAGAITNHASASNGTVTSNQAEATVTASQDPHLALVKQADPQTYDTKGQTISYKYTLTNTGNVTLSAPFTVGDDKIGIFACGSATSLAPGDVLTCTATYTIRQNDLDAGAVTNHAEATATFGQETITSNPDEATVNAVQSPALALVKSASPTTYSATGQVIDYTYVVKNTGNVTLPGPFTISDNKLGTLSCPQGSLAPGASVTCTANHGIVQSDLDAGSITNIASASTTYGTQPVKSNDASVTVTSQSNPALSLTKSANPATFSAAGQVIVYTYVVKNTGNVTLSGPFSVTDDKLGTFQCGTVTSLTPQESVTCKKSYTIQASDLGNTPNFPSKLRATVTYGIWLDGSKSTMDITIGGIAQSAGFPNGIYAGWCIQDHVDGDLFNQQATLYTSTGTNLPTDAARLPWNKINYILNHKIRGAGKSDLAFSKDVQTAIWLVLGETNPDFGISREARQMVSEANANPNYIPGSGDVIAVLVYSDGVTKTNATSIQEIIIEVRLQRPITNRATVSGKAGNSTVTSNTATATITQAAATAKMTPTGTTCSNFTSSTALELSQLLYARNTTGNAISSVAPSGMFYYSRVTAPSANFSVQVAQSNPNAFPALAIQLVSGKPQAFLYTASCAKSSGQGTPTITVNPQTKAQTVSFNVSGATVGATYYIGIKYVTTPLVGVAVSQPYPTIPYTFLTSINNSVIPTSQAGLEVKPKP